MKPVTIVLIAAGAIWVIPAALIAAALTIAVIRDLAAQHRAQRTPDPLDQEIEAFLTEQSTEVDR